MYGENDLSSKELFSGHFINFGYWQDFTPGRHISVEERTESQANLYRAILRRLEIDPTDVMLEVGCGIGVGAALALREFGPSAVWGLDYSQDQLDRARRVHADCSQNSPTGLSSGKAPYSRSHTTTASSASATRWKQPSTSKTSPRSPPKPIEYSSPAADLPSQPSSRRTQPLSKSCDA
jgi:hypothetical protein